MVKLDLHIYLVLKVWKRVLYVCLCAHREFLCVTEFLCCMKLLINRFLVNPVTKFSGISVDFLIIFLPWMWPLCAYGVSLVYFILHIQVYIDGQLRLHRY